MSIETALLGHRTESVMGLYYFGPGDSTDEAPEGVRILLSNGSAVFLSSGSDWTLTHDEETGENLPAWCYPREDWGLRDIPGNKDLSSLGKCRKIEEMTSEVGERIGLKMFYASCTITASAGEPFTVRVGPAVG